jgi:predicted LPLAT superfamily acyltransferase
MKPQQDRPDWVQQKERSHGLILRLMVWISLTFGRRVGRFVLHGIAAYFVLFAPAARRASRAYLSLALGRFAGWGDGYQHVLAFASTIHDRVYLLNDCFDGFEIEVQGEDELREVLKRRQGALLVGAHLGSFEVLRSVGRGVGGLKVAMLMYKENARKLNATLAAINPNAMQDIIPLGRVESMLAVRDKLDEGYAVGMLADRTLGGDTTQTVEFLGQPAELPIGPWRMAAMLKRPVFFMAGLYLGGNRYRIQFERLADFSQVERPQRDEAIRVAIERYADCMTRHCRQAPYNWFNFYDFWKTR